MSEWNPRAFSEYLDGAMRSRGIRNDAELARRSGIRQTQIGNWRNGAARPSMRLLKQVAEALTVAPHDLYVLAGWLDTEQGAEPTPLPPEIQRLVFLYQSMTTEVGRRQVLEQIDTVWRGLKDKYVSPEEEQRPARKRAS